MARHHSAAWTPSSGDRRASRKSSASSSAGVVAGAASDRLWRSYFGDMLLPPHDSASECGTSYGSHSVSTGTYGRSWTQWTPPNAGGGGSGGSWTQATATDCANAARHKYSSEDHRGGDSGNAGSDEKRSTMSLRPPPSPLSPREPFGRPLAWLWVLLSMVVFGVCAFALVQPYWFVSGRPRRMSIGIINYCVQQPSAAAAVAAAEAAGGGVASERCAYYGEQFSLEGVPSLSWRTALLTYVAGCTVLACASLQAAFCLCVGQPHKRRLSLAAGYFQLLAVILLITSLLIYPVGLDSPVAKSACDESGIYYGGSCHIGWSYALAIAGTALCAFCPVLSHYIDYPFWEPSDCPEVDGGDKT